MKTIKREIIKMIGSFKEIDQKYLLLILLSFSISLILLSWLIVPGGFSMDEYSDFNNAYKPAAINIITGEGYTINGQWFTRVPPGFPLIIALFIWIFGSFLSFQITMAVMVLLFSSGSVVLLYLIGKQLWGKFGGFICSLLWVTYPIAIYLKKQPNSEIPFIFFLLLGLYYFLLSIKHRNPLILIFFSGVFVGIAMLIRPIGIGLGVVISFCYLFSTKLRTRTALLGIALIVLGNLVVISPWEFLTYKQTGKIIPLSSLGITSSRLGFTFPVDRDDFREPFTGPDDVVKLAEHIYTNSKEMTSTKEFFKLLGDSFKSNPLSFTKFMFIKLLRPWYATDSGRLDRYLLMIQVPYLALILISVLMVLKNKELYHKALWTLLIPVFYFWGMTIVGMPLLRYLLPIFPILFLFIPVLFVYKEALNE